MSRKIFSTGGTQQAILQSGRAALRLRLGLPCSFRLSGSTRIQTRCFSDTHDLDRHLLLLGFYICDLRRRIRPSRQPMWNGKLSSSGRHRTLCGPLLMHGQNVRLFEICPWLFGNGYPERNSSVCGFFEIQCFVTSSRCPPTQPLHKVPPECCFNGNHSNLI